MNSFFDLAQTRRSTRKFKSDAVPQEIQDKLKQIVLMSPSGHRANPWEFIFVEDKKSLDTISTCKAAGAAFVKDAALAVIVIADTQKTDVWVEDCSIASAYLHLAAEDLGLGSCWVQIRKRAKESGESASEVLKKAFNIPDNYEVLSVIAMGYKEEERKPFDLSRLQLDKIHKETF
ncbi:MAG: nitroreductase family protein [Bacteroidales bacterium]|nr:nitroreductase family protein [Bacteroidales bacterium]